MKFEHYIHPSTLQEAYELYRQEPNSVLLGGCTLLNRRNKAASLGIDITDLGLDEISEKDGMLLIGACVTYTQLEGACSGYFDGIFKKAIPALGAPLKNIITIGGTVAARLGMSDLLTALLALNADVCLCEHEIISLEDYLSAPSKRHIITAVSIPLCISRAAFTSFRNASSGPPALHVAVGKREKDIRIAVGGRPSVAERSKGAEACIFLGGTPVESGKIAAAELKLGSDLHASGEYRKLLCETLVERALLEVGL